MQLKDQNPISSEKQYKFSNAKGTSRGGLQVRVRALDVTIPSNRFLIFWAECQHG